MSQDVVKMKQGMSYSCKEKKIILNVFKYFRKIHPDKGVTEIVRYTSSATGCSEKSIFRFRKEETSPEGFKEPSKTKIRKNININSRFLKYDESVRERIKCIINDLRSKNITPTLSIILKNVNTNDTLPSFSLMTLRRLLFDMGFRYEKEKTTNKPVLVEISDTKIKKNEDIKQNVSETPPTNSNLPKDTAVNNENNQPLNQHRPEVVPHNQTYVQNQNQLYLGYHENSVVEGIPLGFQHTMMLGHRMSHSIHTMPHNVGFMHH
ncbi:uncharacterized protein LOC130896370 [Diorhabda carinulata]|uniref:uncharacterized protein LOC130896370 n=1 Tax=Diorhabda carinulata TaxID=1163345 RepID=UPI0025A24ADC|nr:uncharacterized protein LOC130896370 [Diorhabda carinulata]